MKTKTGRLSLFLGLPFLSSRKQKKIPISTEASKKGVFLKKHPSLRTFGTKNANVARMSTEKYQRRYRRGFACCGRILTRFSALW